MLTRDRTLVPAAYLPAPAPLPSLTSAFSRRAALFGTVSATGFLAASGVVALAKGDATAAFTSALDPTDDRLVALVNELQTGAVALVALSKSDPRDCYDIPGYPAAEDHLNAIVTELHETRAQSMAGIAAMARALQVSFVAEDYQTTGDLAWNLAADILRLTGALS